MIGKYYNMLTWNYIIVLYIEGNTISNIFTIYIYIHIVEIPIQKGVHS